MNQTLNETSDPHTTRAIEQVLSLKSKIEEIQHAQRKSEIEQVHREMEMINDNNKENSDKDSDAETENSPKYFSFFVFLLKATLSNAIRILGACQS